MIRLSSTARVMLLAILALGAFGRVMHASRPFDERSASSWREADYVQIARNYWREDRNLFNPMIDWAGPDLTPVEAELPVIPWIASFLYDAIGYDESAIRWVSSVFALGSLAMFAAIALRIAQSQTMLIASVAFVAFNPLLLRLGSSMQPENAYLCLSLASVLALVYAVRKHSCALLLVSFVLLGVAGALKLPALAIGPLLAIAALRENWSTRVLVTCACGTVACLAISFGWAFWSHQAWVEHGASLGISNETHRITSGLLWPPQFLIGNLRSELAFVITPPGVVLLILAWRMRDTGLPILWYGCLLFLYVVAAHTASAGWAAYYHAASVAPIALLMSIGLQRVHSVRLRSGAGLCVVGWSVGMTILLAYRRDHDDRLHAKYAAAIEFEHLMADNATILVRGGNAFDDEGLPLAYNDSVWFAWMDRRGVQYPIEQDPEQAAEEAIALGVDYWIALQWELDDGGHGDPRVVARSGDFALVRLGPE